MKIVNKSKWNTADLKKLIAKNIEIVGCNKNKQIKIITGKSRFYNMSGLADVGGNWIMMKVPKLTEMKWLVGSDGKSVLQEVPIIFDSITFSEILQHELDHNLGLRHGEMCELSDMDCSWAKDFAVRPKEQKLKQPRNLIQERYEKTAKKVREYEQKKKRTDNLLKKWQKKLKYYEKKKV